MEVNGLPTAGARGVPLVDLRFGSGMVRSFLERARYIVVT